ncbi:putative gustatory receptor clone PTE03 [Chanos chanos]|uniref:Olfactory receptor n=1 Tax=Chanos chanos TaxID=29144 RepID=A0A6J2VRC0_CHACN|nr:putative gustatory receptor clone PTE03 [Chanos chanos]
MGNGNISFTFYLTVFKEQNQFRYFSFMISLLVYLSIIFFNATVLLAVFKEKSLHKPMYFLICCLCINALYGTAGFFPRLLIDFLSDTHKISRQACFTQISVIYTYAVSEYTILTLMAFDRHVAICHPLRYHSIMTPKLTVVCIACAVIYTIFYMSLGIYFLVSIPLCGNEIERLYCSNWSVVRLSCVNTMINNILGYCVTITTVFAPASFIIFTYVRILIICQKMSSEHKGKALQTCVPHIVTFVNYSVASFCDVALSRYDLGKYQVVALVFSVEFLVIPPILNPLMYGLSLPDIRKKILCLFHFSK